MPQALYRMALFYWAPIFWFREHPQACWDPPREEPARLGVQHQRPHGHGSGHFRQLNKVSPTTAPLRRPQAAAMAAAAAVAAGTRIPTRAPQGYICSETMTCLCEESATCDSVGWTASCCCCCCGLPSWWVVGPGAGLDSDLPLTVPAPISSPLVLVAALAVGHCSAWPARPPQGWIPRLRGNGPPHRTPCCAACIARCGGAIPRTAIR